MELFADRYTIADEDLNNMVTYVTIDVYKDNEEFPFMFYTIILKGFKEWHKNKFKNKVFKGHYKIYESKFKDLHNVLFIDNTLIDVDDEEIKEKHKELNAMFKTLTAKEIIEYLDKNSFDKLER